VRFGDELAVDEVTPDTPASKAGLKAGDKIVKVGDAKVESMQDLGPALFGAEGKLVIVVQRDGKEVTLTVEMPERP
jgi:S1-C subfamily serine protease